MYKSFAHIDLTKQNTINTIFFDRYYFLTIFPFTSIYFISFHLACKHYTHHIHHFPPHKRTSDWTIDSVCVGLQSVYFSLSLARSLAIFCSGSFSPPYLLSKFVVFFSVGHLLLFIFIRQLCARFLMPGWYIYQIDENPSIVCYEHRYVTNISRFAPSLTYSVEFCRPESWCCYSYLLNNCWRWSFKKPFLCIDRNLLHAYTPVIRLLIRIFVCIYFVQKLKIVWIFWPSRSETSVFSRRAPQMNHHKFNSVNKVIPTHHFSPSCFNFLLARLDSARLDSLCFCCYDVRAWRRREKKPNRLWSSNIFH